MCERCFGQQANLGPHLKKHEMDGQDGVSVSPGSSPEAGDLHPDVMGSPLMAGSDGSGAASAVPIAGADVGYFADIRNFMGKVTGQPPKYSAVDSDDDDELTCAESDDDEETKSDRAAAGGSVRLEIAS